MSANDHLPMAADSTDQQERSKFPTNQAQPTPSESPRLVEENSVGDQFAGEFISKMSRQDRKEYDSIDVYTVVYGQLNGKAQVRLTMDYRNFKEGELDTPMKRHDIRDVADLRLKTLGLRGLDMPAAMRGNVKDLGTFLVREVGKEKDGGEQEDEDEENEDDESGRLRVATLVQSMDDEEVLKTWGNGMGQWVSKADIEDELAGDFLSEGMMLLIMEGFGMLQSRWRRMWEERGIRE